MAVLTGVGQGGGRNPSPVEILELECTIRGIQQSPFFLYPPEMYSLEGINSE